MPMNNHPTPATAILNGECRYCGRDFGDAPNGPCLETDECPSHFEALGIPHSDHPYQPLGDRYAS